MNDKVSAETLNLIKAAQLSGTSEVPPELMKAWTQPGSAVSGINAYDLEAPAKQLYPVITPLRNELPRVSGKGGIQANWRAITGINTTNLALYLATGKRGGVMTTTTQDYTAAYKGIGLEDSVEFEADYAAEFFQDLKATAVEGLLRATMIGEEKIILGGNNGLSLANTGSITLTTANTGGTLNNQSYGVGCVALTFEGFQLASLTTGIVQSYTRTNADSSTDLINGGTNLKATQANVTVNTQAGTISASVTPIAGAVAYAWFWGAAAANLTLGAITTISSALITANATGTGAGNGTANYAALGATNNSTNSLAFDGFLTIASQSALGSYQGTLAVGVPGTGTALTSDGAGGVAEIETALKSFWDNYRLSPDTLWVSAQEMKNISAKVVSASASNPLALRFTVNADQSMMAGGIIVREYLNRYAMDGNTVLKIRLHPNMPAGTMLFTTSRLPYPLSNVTNVAQIRTRRDYYQIEWPLRTRKYEYGVYADEVLQHYFPPAIGVVTNIANG